MSRPKIWVNTPDEFYSGGPHLSITVRSASGLPRAGLSELFRAPDPSAYIRVDSTERGNTSEKKRTCSPKWNKRIVLPVKHNSIIEVEIVHQRNRETMLGSVEIRLDEVVGLHLGPVTMKQPILKRRSNGEQPLNLGKLTLELCCVRGNMDKQGHLPPGWEWRLDNDPQIGYYNHVTQKTVYARPANQSTESNDLSPALFTGLNWIDRQGILPSGWTWTNVPSAGRQYTNQRTGAISWVRPCTITHDDPTGANNPRPNDSRLRKTPLQLLLLPQMDHSNDDAPSPRIFSTMLLQGEGRPPMKRASTSVETHLSGSKHELRKARQSESPPKGNDHPSRTASRRLAALPTTKLQRSNNPFAAEGSWHQPPTSDDVDLLDMDEPDLPLIIPEGDIEIREFVPHAFGGFCDLFIGMHRTVGKVALKRLRVAVRNHSSEEMRSLKREAKTWQTLVHSHILRFLGTAVINGQMFLVSPFMEHGALKAYIARHPGIDRTKFIREAVSALVYLHACGIIHGDIKADNILVSPDIRALVCDFGLSKMTDVSTSTDVKGAGSIRWQCPHLLRGGHKSFNSDVYALGMAIYEILSGNLPYHQYTSNAPVITAILAGERPPCEPAGSRPGFNDYAPFWYVARSAWVDDVRLRPTMVDAADWMKDAPPAGATSRDNKPGAERERERSPRSSSRFTPLSSILSFRTARSDAYYVPTH